MRGAKVANISDAITLVDVTCLGHAPRYGVGKTVELWMIRHGEYTPIFVKLCPHLRIARHCSKFLYNVRSNSLGQPIFLELEWLLGSTKPSLGSTWNGTGCTWVVFGQWGR